MNTARTHQEKGAPEQYVHLRLKPEWAYIEEVREFCRSFCDRNFDDLEIAERVRVVIQELLENAMKYSVDNGVSELELDIKRDPNELRIAVSNQAQTEHRERLAEQIRELSAKEPQAAYLEAMQRSMTLETGESQLGLARMRFEGRVELSLQEADGWVTIIATGTP